MTDSPEHYQPDPYQYGTEPSGPSWRDQPQNSGPWNTQQYGSFPRKKKSHPNAWKVWVALICCLTLAVTTVCGISLADRYLKSNYASGSFHVLTAASTASKEAYNSIADLTADVEDCVVSLSFSTQSSLYTTYTLSTTGTGIIIGENDANIYIAANYQLVENYPTVTVYFSGDTQNGYPAEIQGKDSDTDLAVLFVTKSSLPEGVLTRIKIGTFGDSSTCQIGDLAVAIGCPYSIEYGNSVTVGTISGTERSVAVQETATNTIRYMDFIQTDATINPGNSGGPLFNGNGEIIGVVNHKIEDTTVEGMGFATPSNIAAPVLEALVNYGKVSRPYLGIIGMDVVNYSDFSVTYNVTSGVYVKSVVEGSGAQAAGIQAGDVIVQVDDTTISVFNDLSEYLSNEVSVGQVLEVTILRGFEQNDVQTIVLNVTVGEKNSNE